MQTRDEVEGLHNSKEFFQPLECLYQAMKHREKVFYYFYKITLLRKNEKLFVIASPQTSFGVPLSRIHFSPTGEAIFVMTLTKREILTSRKVLYTKSFTFNQLLFCQKMLSKIRIFQLKRKKVDTACF